MSETDLLRAAQSGDEAAFASVAASYRRELHVHCYRLLGSFDDAEDAVQETLLAAWRGLAAFRGRASVRTWLYKVATNTCLNLIRSASRRPQMTDPLPASAPAPTGSAEVTWLQPYPDLLLDELPDHEPGPEARIERAEAVSLAFVTALQLLSPRARAVLVLRDVLGFSAAETAETLGTTPQAVAMTLSQARAALREHAPAQAAAFAVAPGKPHAALTDPDQVTAWWSAKSTTGSEEAGGELRITFGAEEQPTVMRVLAAHRLDGVAWQVVSSPLVPDWTGTGRRSLLRRLRTAADWTSPITAWSPLECFELCNVDWGRFLVRLGIHAERD